MNKLSLPDQVRALAEFDEIFDSVDGDDERVYYVNIFRLKPALDALADCVDLLEDSIEDHHEGCICWKHEALAKLRDVLSEGGEA